MKMRISFCLICYNEAYLIRQQLINLYPHAYEIIIVEGRSTELGDKFPKTRDKTLQIIRDFPDPDNKIILITKDTWVGKDAMVAAYYNKATGDYVWHIDADEFYTPECIEGTRAYIDKTQTLNYSHHEYYYYRYYNVVVAKDGTKKFWNRPARIHKKKQGLVLIHRPQIIRGSAPKDIRPVPKEIGIRHHYSIMDLEKVAMKAQFYGYDMHSKYFSTYKKPLEKLIDAKICVRPDNDRKPNNIPAVLESDELQIPPGIDELFNYYEHEQYPWTISDRIKREMFPEKFTSGVIYPIPPAFDSQGDFDQVAVENYLEHLHKNGAKIILVTAGTARFNMLTNHEIEALNASCNQFQGTKILGLPPVPDKLLSRWIDHANSWEPDAVMLMYPDRYYSDEDVCGYFFRAADKLKVPVMVHGMFMRNAVAGGTYNFTPEIVAKLKKHDNIIGMKEESTSYEMAYKVSRQADHKFLIFPAGGSCRRYLLTQPAGAQNFLGGIGNIYPQIEEAFYIAMKEGLTTTAHKIVERYEDPLFAVFGPIGWHRALQIALNVKGLLKTTNRISFGEAKPEHVKAVKAVLQLIESRLDKEGL
jgi:4-hydroxy-2-oxoglutarate aldolase